MFNEKNLPKLIILIPIIFIITAVVTIFYIFVSQLNEQFEYEVELSEQQELQLQKQYLKSHIENIDNYIKHKRVQAKERFKQRLQERVEIGYTILDNIYNKYQSKLSKKEIESKITEAFRQVRFDRNGYLILVHMKDDTHTHLLVHPAVKPSYNFHNQKDVDGNYFVRHTNKLIKTKGKGFIEYSWKKPKSDIIQKKISFVKGFNPYNWYIVYGEYLDDFEQNIKEEAKKRLDLYRFGKNGYIWTQNTDYIMLQHPYLPRQIGKNQFNIEDKKGTKIAQLFISKALKNKEGSFAEYYWNKPNTTQVSKKIGYVKYIPEWDWVIGTGAYIEDIQENIFQS